MKPIRLTRFAYLPWATLGKICHPELRLSWYTLELPWNDNIPRISCIPEGTYEVKPDQEGRFTGFPELQNVPNRTEIIIHPANWTSQLEGCIALGKRFEAGLGGTAVWESNVAHKEFIDTFGTEFTLEITVKRAEWTPKT